MAKSKKQKEEQKRKDRKIKTRRVLDLIKQTCEQRGNESEESIIEALESLPGAVSYERSEKYSLLDNRGKDFIINVIPDGNKKMTFPLQIKSSLYFALKFVKQSNGKIPVLVKTPGATKDSIVTAISKIIERKQGGDKGIIEIAKLDSEH